jgi:hypothetical protein
MSQNYLNNLLSKTAQTQNLVEPRLKSRFENNSGLSPKEREDVGNIDSGESEKAAREKRHPLNKHAVEEHKADMAKPSEPF